jgi:quinol monooxygenase YgiN
LTQLIILVTVVVHPEDAEAFQSLAATMMLATRAEPGCIEYTFSRAIDETRRFMLTERWQDAAALQTHFATPHMRDFLNAARALRIERREATRYAIASAETF